MHNRSAISDGPFSILCLFVTIGCIAQPTIEWEKSLGGTYDDRAYSIKQTGVGGYIVAGYAHSGDGDVTGHHGTTTYPDYWIVNLTCDGDISWQNSLGGTSDDKAMSVGRSNAGGYIVAGYSYSNDGDISGNYGAYDYWVLELDPFGSLVWQKALGGYSTDNAYCIQPTIDRGYIVVGYSHSNSGDVTGHHGSGLYSDYWIAKTDSLGAIQWQKSLGGDNGDNAYSICQTSTNGYIVAGFSNSTDGDITGHRGQDDFWVVKLNPSGIIEWQKSLGGSACDRAYAVQETKDYGFIIAGCSASNDSDVTGNHGGYDYWLAKLDFYGELQWQKSLGGSQDDFARSIFQTSDSGYVVAGYSRSSDGDVSVHYGIPSYTDYWIVKIDSIGNIEWEKTLGGNYNDMAYSIRQTNDGGYIVAGCSNSIDCDVTGNRGNYDYWVVKLTPYPVGVSERSEPAAFAISTYPNPFNSAVRIGVESGELRVESVEIYDVNGRRVAEIPPRTDSSAGPPLTRGEKEDTPLSKGVDSHCESGGFVWRPAPSLGSGVYLIRATFQQQAALAVCTKRIVYLK